MARFILTLVRHGQTIFNQDGIIQGQMDVPLSEEGRKQIWLLAKALEQHRFTKIFASDLQRATETAQAIVDHGTVERPKVVTDQRLRERGYGRLEGVPAKEYLGQAKMGKHHKDFTPEGGETIDQVRKRAVSFFKELCDDFLEGNANQIPPTKCVPIKKNLKSDDGTNSSAETPPNPEPSIASSEVSASNEVDVPLVDFTVGPSSDDEDSRDQADGSSLGLASDIQTCFLSKPQQSGSKTPHCHRQSPLSHQYAPNVTLSPSSMGGSESQEGAIEISCSEGSQDTDDFDEEVDLDGMVADVLVVAHGALIRELMRYFIEDLNCFVPKGPSLANRVTFNTGMSRFQVDLLDGFPKMECLSIHQIDHLHQP